MQRILIITLVLIFVIFNLSYINAAKNQTANHTTKKPSSNVVTKGHSGDKNVTKNESHRNITKNEHDSKNVTESHVSKNETAEDKLSYKPMDAKELGKKVAQLKKQAVKLMELQGFKVKASEDTPAEPVAMWDDIQVTDDLYYNLKAIFDKEQKNFEEGNVDRATAPDFGHMPLAKWSMPIKYTLNYVKSDELKGRIKKAVGEIQSATTCIKFQEEKFSPWDEPFIQFMEVSNLGKGVCGDSPIGKQTTRTNLVRISPDCKTLGVVQHEVMHSLGFAHTQQRPDADKYIKINFNNLPKDDDTLSNFNSWLYALNGQGTFDYGSVMMYRSTAFAKPTGAETMTPKIDPEKNRDLMGQRNGLSNEDKNILEKVYCTGIKWKTDCQDTDPSCEGWKDAGYCDKVKSPNEYPIASKKCPFACNVCH